MEGDVKLYLHVEEVACSRHTSINSSKFWSSPNGEGSLYPRLVFSKCTQQSYFCTNCYETGYSLLLLVQFLKMITTNSGLWLCKFFLQHFKNRESLSEGAYSGCVYVLSVEMRRAHIFAGNKFARIITHLFYIQFFRILYCRLMHLIPCKLSLKCCATQSLRPAFVLLQLAYRQGIVKQKEPSYGHEWMKIPQWPRIP